MTTVTHDPYDMQYMHMAYCFVRPGQTIPELCPFFEILIYSWTFVYPPVTVEG